MLLVREAPASPYRFLILDAKYSAQTTVLKARLPDLISKYYCGLGILHPGGVVLPPPLVGLAALHPTVNPGEAVAGPNHLAPEFATDNHLLLVPMVGAVPCMPGHLTELAAYMKEITKRWHRLNFAEDTKPA
jgi:hypothetical protein